MKNFLYKTLIAFILLAQNLLTFAYDFEVDGIYYNITSTEKSEVEATHGQVYSSGDVVIPEYVTFNKTTYKVTGIGERAFDGGHVHSLTIPATVVTLSRSFVRPFSKNLNILVAFYVDENNPMYKAVDGVLYSKDLSELIRFPFKKSGVFIIPHQVKKIKQYAFDDCGGVTSVSAESVEEIENHSFSWTYNLKTVVFSQSLKEIGDSAFYNSNVFESVVLPDKLLSIGRNAFLGCKQLTLVESKIKDPFEIELNVFGRISSEATLIVPKGTFNLYNALDCWVHNFKYVKEEGTTGQTYTLSIKSTGNGSASYNETTIRSKTSTFTINEETKVAISLTPDNGYRIKSVKENGTNVTSYVSNGTYTINSISRNTNIEVEFEAIPLTTYTLSIKATGNGSASYDGTTIRGKTSSYTVNEGTSATIKFTLDNGYRIKSVKFNSTNVTSSVYDNQYTISNINANTTLEVEFEVIPIPTYTLTIKATGNGSASYNGTTIRENTSSYTVNEGTKISISLTPDNGYRIKSVKENDTNLTSYVSNGTYIINSISRNTSIEVEFEAIPPTTYTLSIKALGNGSASYDGTTIRGKTSSFSINEGTSATIKFTPNNGYRIKSVKLNNTDVTSGVSDNQYTISNITANATLEVEFEAIPVPTYTLSITTTGNGSSTYDGIEVKNRMTSFTVNEGTNATITFSPDNGNSIASVKLNNSDVTSQVSGNRYTINNITDNTTLIVTFQEDVKALTVDGVNYTVVSQADRTVKVTGGDFGQVLTVPATVAQNGKTWTVTGIDTNALNGNTQLAAVIWNLDMAFTATVSNPNMLLYVKAEQYAPSAIQNVVVNGIASDIIMTEAQSGNNFYCPQTFVAQKISYTHNYQMQTGLGESKGWETIALPFDVQTITHETKGTIVPFAQWNNDSNKKPFWLMELTGSGFVEAGNIKANTPYIISMPNHPQYDSQWLLNGKVTFAASSVTVGKTENLNQSVNNGRTFVPCFAGEKADEGFYALNVSNDWETNKSGMTEGSKFVLNMRQVHPFEAYMTSSSNAAQYFDVFDDMTTGIHQMVDGKWMMEKAVYDLQGRKVENPSKKGVYIVNGKKMIIK